MQSALQVIGADKKQLSDAGLPPLDQETRLKGAMQALSEALALYDSYLLIVAVINEDDRIRRFFNQSDLGYGIMDDQLETISDEFVDISNISHVQDQIALYRNNINQASI